MSTFRSCWRYASAFTFMLLTVSGRTSAQTKVKSVDSVATFQAIPSDPVFDLLGLPGNNIQQPGTISNFLLSIQPLVLQGGSLSPGVAIAFAPYQLCEGDRLQLNDYLGSWWTRLLTNTELSVGTARSKGSDSSQDWGVGLKIVMFNTGDGRLDGAYIDRLYESALELYIETPLPKPGTLIGTADEVIIIDQFILSSDKIRGKIKNMILKPDGVNVYWKSIQESLDTLAFLSDSLEAHGQTVSAGLIRRYIAVRRDPVNLQGLKEEYQKATSAIGIKNKLNADGDSPDWNTSSLDLDFGAVYRASNAIVQHSVLSKSRVWVNGSWGLGNSQVIGQVGYYRQYPSLGQSDSSRVTAAVMYRYGSKDVRFGAGTNTVGFTQGSFILAAEIRVSSSAWVIASFDRDFMKGQIPTWSPAIGVKTTSGVFGL